MFSKKALPLHGKTKHVFRIKFFTIQHTTSFHLMKKFILFFAFLIASMTLSVGNVQAATAAFATTTNVAPATVSPQSVAKKLNKAVRDGDNKILAIICAIFIPPLGVYLKEGSGKITINKYNK